MKTKAKCPKCKSTNLTLTEIWNGHSIQWVQENGEFDKNEGNLHEGGPVKVEAKCSDCNHSWTFRGITQIDDLIQIK
jgi:predicted Zn-ribbon and HTH transcriptional regulator